MRRWWNNLSSEQRIQIETILKCLVIVLCAFLYSAGGMSDYGGKWLRRFLMPSVAVSCMLVYTRDWRCLIQLPFWMGALSMGYGAEGLIDKIWKRFSYGILTGIASSGKLIIDRNWLLVCFQITLLIGAYIVFGVWNPFPSARAEETILGMFQVTIPILGAKRRTGNV